MNVATPPSAVALGGTTALPSVAPVQPSWWLAEALTAEGRVPECPPLRGEVTADVTSAVPLSDSQMLAITAALKQTVGRTVSLTSKIDASILGGLIVRVGSRMVDSSIKSKLQRLKLAMKGVG